MRQLCLIVLAFLCVTQSFGQFELPEERFKPNNIVVVLDISLSMKPKDRIRMAKEALRYLVFNLRAVDKFSLITYSEEADLVIETTPVDNQDPILNEIDSIEAGGTAPGINGVRKAFTTLTKAEILGGNNQIILITESPIDILNEDKNFGRMVKLKANKNGYKLSVLGVKNEAYTVKSMKKLAKLGGGNYMELTSLGQAETILLDEVKAQSLIVQ